MSTSLALLVIPQPTPEPASGVDKVFWKFPRPRILQPGDVVTLPHSVELLTANGPQPAGREIGPVRIERVFRFCHQRTRRDGRPMMPRIIYGAIYSSRDDYGIAYMAENHAGIRRVMGQGDIQPPAPPVTVVATPAPIAPPIAPPVTQPARPNTARRRKGIALKGKQNYATRDCSQQGDIRAGDLYAPFGCQLHPIQTLKISPDGTEWAIFDISPTPGTKMLHGIEVAVLRKGQRDG